MQFQADLLGVRVARPENLETTALGAVRPARGARGVAATALPRGIWPRPKRVRATASGVPNVAVPIGMGMDIPYDKSVGAVRTIPATCCACATTPACSHAKTSSAMIPWMVRTGMSPTSNGAASPNERDGMGSALRAPQAQPAGYTPRPASSGDRARRVAPSPPCSTSWWQRSDGVAQLDVGEERQRRTEVRRAERDQAEHTIGVVGREPAGGEAGVGVGDYHDRARMRRGEPMARPREPI